MTPAATIKLHVDPVIQLGPLTVAWHGLMIAVGIVAGAWLARRYARERGLDVEAVLNLVLLIAVSGIVGARLLWLLESGAISNPGEWLGTRGFSFYGGILLGVPAVAIYLRREGLGARYLDALAAGFPLGMAVGRIGDVINGEHFGPQSDLPWAFRHTHPDAEVPTGAVAYHSGGFYELVLALAILAIVWPLRRRFATPGVLLGTVVALYGAGRFAMFFVRSDSDELALGLVSSQWVSLLLVALALGGIALARRAAGAPVAPPRWARAPLASILAIPVVALASCGSDGSGQADAPGPRPAPTSTADLPPKLAANVKDADKIVGEGEGDFRKRLDRLKGHPVVVNQWASWCEPCRFEIPFFRSMTAKYAKQVGFLGIDMQDERGAAEDFMRELPSGFPSVFDPDASVTRSLGGGNSSPTTFFLDERGKVVNVKIGAYSTAELLDQDIRRHLRGNPPSG